MPITLRRDRDLLRLQPTWSGHDDLLRRYLALLALLANRREIDPQARGDRAERGNQQRCAQANHAAERSAEQ